MKQYWTEHNVLVGAVPLNPGHRSVVPKRLCQGILLPFRP